MDIEKPITGGYFTGEQFPIGLLLHSYSVQEWGLGFIGSVIPLLVRIRYWGLPTSVSLGPRGWWLMGLAYSNELL